ncbi:TAXI family TRAP transporter solute-binding subunit [Roseomonas sp. BN140053]|uniref:TAXI family TRAP transporter solute-binding subunit n=1 Tax=Roseomonas sp. BN140053 TaxID=3391898 RepID=UPI0039EB2087
MPRTSRRAGSGQSSSIGKALTVLRAFMDQKEQWGVRELATVLDQPLSSTHWLLQVLRAEGLVEWSAGRQRYLIGPELERWGAALGKLSKRHALGREAAAALAAATGAACCYAAYDTPRRRLLVVAQVPEDATALPPLGTALPLADGPAGWAVAALLPDTERMEWLTTAPARARAGVAAVRAGVAAGDGLIAAAVSDAVGSPLGALLLAAPPEQSGCLRSAADTLAQRLGGRILAGVRGTAPRLLAELGTALRERLPELSLEDAELGNTDRLTAVEEGRAGYCAVTLERIEAAWRGVPPFAEPHGRLRLVLPLAALQLHVLVRADGPLHSVADLLTARAAAGEADYVTAEVWREVLALVAPSPAVRRRASARMVSLPYAEANRAFAVGELDALVSLNAAPTRDYEMLGREVPLRLIPLPPALMERFVARHPTFTAGAIDPAAYGAGGASVATLVTVLGLVTSATRSESEVGQVAQALERKLRETGQPALFWPDSTAVPLHPAVKR